jgi:[acyl-carrier-protein] S-malonyltransferase
MVVFTFPGQGSQRAGMGLPWRDHPSWELVADAAQVSGRDIGYLLCDAPAEELTSTRNSQLATFVLSLVVLDAVERTGLAPAVCAGHSLGEYTALVAAGSLTFEDGVRVVAERGEAMHEIAERSPGRMVALIGLSDDDVEVACQRAESDVWVANYNAPGQVVIAGTEEGIEAALAVANTLGLRRAMPLPVAGAFHTPLVAPARQRLRKALAAASLRTPEVPVYSNVDARPHSDPEEWPGLLSTQLCSPVRWHQTLTALAETAGSSLRLVEVGPGGVLTGLARRTLPGTIGYSVAVPDDLDRLFDALRGDLPARSLVGAREGEHLYVSERLVVSPAAGVFEPDGRLADIPMNAAPQEVGTYPVHVGELIGTVGTAEVRSPFAGSLVGLLAHSGERVTVGQPIAWLRTEAEQ